MGTLSEFLLQEQLKKFDIVLSYELGSGLQVLTGKTLYEQIMPYGENPVDPPGAVAFLDHFLRVCTQLRSASSEEIASLSLSRRNYHVAIILASAELSFPASSQSSRDYTLHSTAAVVRSWSRETQFIEQNLAVFLLTEQVNDLHTLLARNSRAAVLEIPLPDETELTEAFRYFEGRFPKALSRFAGHPELCASRLAGATLSSIESMLKQREFQGLPLTNEDLGEWKKSLVEKDARGLVDFMQPTRNLDDFCGSEEVKTWLRQDIALWESGDLSALPMGYLICGPVGTGKTFLVECLAGEAKVPVVKLKNFRDRWVGSTEGNLEKIFSLLHALGRCFVFVDEADQALGSRDSGSGDAGLSGRIYSMMAKEMGDTENRGKIIWILASSRPDQIEVDLKRPGRVDVKFPLFPALDGREGYALVRALGKKYKLDLPAECPADLLSKIPPLITPGAAESLIVKTYRTVRTSRKDALSALSEVFEEYQSPVPETTMRFQIDLAVSEASDLSFVPTQFRA